MATAATQVPDCRHHQPRRSGHHSGNLKLHLSPHRPSPPLDLRSTTMAGTDPQLHLPRQWSLLCNRKIKSLAETDLKSMGELEKTSEKKEDDVICDQPVRVYGDGIYDLFPCGHARSLEQAKKSLESPPRILTCGRWQW